MANDAVDRHPGRLTIFLVLFSSFLVLIAAGSISVSYSVRRHWEGILRQEITRSLTQKARLFADRVDTDRTHKIADITSQAGHNAGARATVIDMNGKVLADSEVPVANLEQEGHTPEFLIALRGETGTDTRRRGPFGVPVLYVAVPISGGAVRLAYPLADLGIARATSRQVLLLGVVISVLTALAISALAAQTISRQRRS
jgi:two-component system, OmpR family, phosphate regulon sensor histidine kinase PhoR